MESVETLLKDIRLVSEERYETIQAVRMLVKKLVNPLSEDVKYGGILFSSGAQFGGVFAYKDHVSVEFSMGARIIDAFGHLEGSGKLRRHVKLAAPGDADAKRLDEYVPLAVKAACNAA